MVNGLEQPVFATHAGDGSGRLFDRRKGGQDHAAYCGRPARAALPGHHQAGGQQLQRQGLAGSRCFHPDFADNGRLFVYYTDKNGDTAISRFQANDERTLADPGSEVVLLQQEQPRSNHNGGRNKSFWARRLPLRGPGDGGGAGDRYDNGQNLETILGTLISCRTFKATKRSLGLTTRLLAKTECVPNLGLWAAQSVALQFRPRER